MSGPAGNAVAINGVEDGADAGPTVAGEASVSRELRLPTIAYPLLGLVGVLAIFELLARLEIVPSRYFPPVSETFRELVDRAGTVEYWQAVGYTLEGWAIGLAIAIALAVPIGILIGTSQVIYRSLRPIIEFLRPIPSVALVPLAILVYGRGLETKVFLIVFASFWPLLIQALYGVRDVDPVASDTARAYGLGRLARLRWITLPSALPYIATGVRLASAIALILAVTAELIVGVEGLGSGIRTAQASGAIEFMYALIITTGILGWLLNSLALRLEARMLSWHPSHRGTGSA